MCDNRLTCYFIGPHVGAQALGPSNRPIKIVWVGSLNLILATSCFCCFLMNATLRPVGSVGCTILKVYVTVNHRPCIGKTSHQGAFTGDRLCEVQEVATSPCTGISVTVLCVQFHTVLTSLMRA